MACWQAAAFVNTFLSECSYARSPTCYPWLLSNYSSRVEELQQCPMAQKPNLLTIWSFQNNVAVNQRFWTDAGKKTLLVWPKSRRSGAVRAEMTGWWDSCQRPPTFVPHPGKTAAAPASCPLNLFSHRIGLRCPALRSQAITGFWTNAAQRVVCYMKSSFMVK